MADYKPDLYELYIEKETECKKLLQSVRILILLICLFAAPIKYLISCSAKFPDFIFFLVCDIVIEVVLIFYAFKKYKTLKTNIEFYDSKSREISRNTYKESNGLIEVPLELKHRNIKISFIAGAIAVFISASVLLNSITSFNIDRWTNHKALRGFMLCSFSDYQRSISYDDAQGNKEKYPNLLRSYTREELDGFFKNDEKTCSEYDVNIKYSDKYNGNIILDVYYCYTDIFGKDYWILMFYNRTEDGKNLKYSYSEIVTSGTEVTLGEFSFDINK